MNCDDLNSLISEDLISEEDIYDMPSDHLTECILQPLSYVDKFNSNFGNESSKLDTREDDTECLNHSQISAEHDADQETETLKAYSKINRNGGGSLRNRRLAVNKFGKKNVEIRQLKLPNSGKKLPTNAKSLLKNQRINVAQNEICSDYSELENQINDSLLDILQDKMLENYPKTTPGYRTTVKQTDDSLKFITIFPAKSGERTINLMVRGKTCRSKQPLDASEMRIVTRILHQENMFGRKNAFYKNVYYDPESDANIRYEVRRKMLTEFSSNSSNVLFKRKSKVKPTSLIPGGKTGTGSDESKFVWNKVARTRFGRISRPPRHVIRDYKRLKHLSELNYDVDESEYNGGYSDYDLDDDIDASDGNRGKELEKRDLYGPLEPNKRQFSSLSICPSCNKVYLGYRRMAIHFQKYPEHKNEELLKQLLENRKKEVNNENGLCDERLKNTEIESCRKCNLPQNNTLSKNNKLHRKLNPPSLRSPAADIKELLSRFGTKEVVKHAAPIVAEVLSSWEYLLLRSEQLKSQEEETLLMSLVKEVKVILAQVQAISSRVLKPVMEENVTLPNKLTIEPTDVLQHVLGVSPGTYVFSDSKPSFNAASKKQDASPSSINLSTPSNPIQSTNNTTGKSFDEVVAECLREDSSDFDSAAATVDKNAQPNYQNVTVLPYDRATTFVDTAGANEVPIFATSNELPLSMQLVVPETTKPAKDVDGNSPLLLDFDVFTQSCYSNPQISTNPSTLFENDYRTRDKSQAINESSTLLLPDNIPAINKINNPNLPINDILDFSLLE